MSEFHRRRASKTRSGQGSTATPNLFFNGKGSSLPDHITKQDIRQHFSDFESKIAKVVLFRDKSGKSQGRGFVEFESKEAAGEALSSLRGVQLMGTIPIHLNYFTKGGRKKQNEPQASTMTHPRVMPSKFAEFASSDICKLFISCHGQRFPEYVSDLDLQHHFKSYGKDVVRAYIARDSRTNRSQGFGYVEFASISSASKAKRQFSGSLLLNEFPIYIDFDKPVLLPEMVSAPLHCSSEHLLYLRSYFFVKPSKKSKCFRAKLPAKLIDKDNSLTLCGSKDDVESSEQTINKELLFSLRHTMVLLHYPLEFESLLGEDFLTLVNPSQDGVKCILQDESTESETESGKLTKKMYLFSQDPKCLQETTRKMKVTRFCIDVKYKKSLQIIMPTHAGILFGCYNKD